MYTVLLADDESHILDLLEQLIDWASLEIKVIARCRNGTETYQAITSLCPDIVIIDIKMPGMSGLDVIKQVYLDSIAANS